MTQNRYIDLLISDCDGVLIDSEIIAEHVMHEVLGELFPARELEKVLTGTFGLQTRDILKRVEAHFDTALPDGFLARQRALTEARIRLDVQPIAGAREALQAIDLPLAVASNSRHEAVAFALQRCALEDRVTHGVYCAEHVERPKPAPDVYLLAARTVDVPVQRCLVIEDSATGVIAALRAGMRVIGFLGASHIPPEHGQTLRQLGVEHLISDMRELPALVERLAGEPARTVPLPP